MRKLFNLTFFTCLLALLPATVAGASVPHFEAASANGGTVFFTTSEKLVPGDADNRADIYERSFESGLGAFVTRELSTGPTGGNDAVDALFEAISESGSRVFFQATEPLVAADTDRNNDVYVREVGAGSPELATVGEAGQNGAADASFVGSSPDGEEVFFVTAESLSSEDQDNADDIYERDLSSGETHLVSSPAAGCATCEPNAFPFFNAVSAGGQRVFFASSGKLSPADGDSAIDIYVRDLPHGPTELVSAGSTACQPGCGNDSSQDAVFAGSSKDGAKVFFETAEPLAEGDTDEGNDVYERAGGDTTLISPGTEDTPANVARESGTFRPAISADGGKVFFQTTEALPGDSDEANDVYEYSGGTVRLVTPNGCTGTGCGATFDALTPDGSKLAFTSAERLAVGDEDSSPDVYVVATAGGSPVLASGGASSCAPGCGNSSAFAAIFNRMSSDASVVVFNSEEELSPLDGDSDSDLFARDLGVEETEVVSAPGLCPLLAGCDAGFAGASSLGSKVFFLTAERLDPEDKDSEVDLYERDREAAATRLVSRENEQVIGPSIPVLSGTNPASPGASTTPAVRGKSDPNTTIKLYLGAGCHGLPVQTQTPATAAQLEGAGIVVAVEPGTTTVFSASASDEEGVDSACSGSITYTQQDPASPPGGGGSGGGSPPGGSTGGASTGTRTGGGSKAKTGIVYVVPLARITFGPAAKTHVRRPVFQFADATGQPGSTFFCKLDRKRWKPCASPLTLPRLGLGKHVFKLTAVNAIGVPAQAPMRRKFRVVRR
jgi:Tol biopolymer transport system component